MRLRLMTHNVWERDDNTKEWAEKGFDCSAQARLGGIMRVYDETMPDVIGLQEVTPFMGNLINESFSLRPQKYAMIWGNYAPIIYRTDKLELIDSEFALYPETIEGMGGPFNNDKRKSWCVAVFRIKENGKIFVYSTTHLWWKRNPTEEKHYSLPNYQPLSNEARAWQMAFLMGKLEEYSNKYDCPMILTGDMNSTYNSLAIKTALDKGFVSAFHLATEYADNTMGYHYCYPDRFETYYYDKPFESAIDHILIKKAPPNAVKRFERYSPEYYYAISDHSPAFVDIEIE